MPDISLAYTLNENGLALLINDTPTHSSVTAGVADPTVTGFSTEQGAIYLRTDGTLYIKTGALDTDWSIAATEDFVAAGFQPLDSDLTALASTVTTGLYTITGVGTSATRSLVQPAAGITITNPDGVAGNPTFALANDLAALEGLAGTGLAVRIALNTWTQRTIQGTTNRISVSDGNGVAADPAIDIAATYVGQASITTLGTITTGVWNGTTIAIANGGTGQTTQTAAFDALAPTTTKGDLIVHDGVDNVRQAVGTNNFVLTADSSTGTGIKWAAVAGTVLQLYHENPVTPTASTVGGNNSVAIGQGQTASGQDSIVVGGANNTASATYSFAQGNRAVASSYGQASQASGRFTADGDAQTSVLVLRTQTINTATVTEMFLDGVGGTQRMVLPNDTTWGFRILVAARETGADNFSAIYSFVGGIDRNASAASTAIVGTVSKTVVAEDDVDWDCNVNADTTNGSLRIQVTGEVGDDINWVARVERVEVTG